MKSLLLFVLMTCSFAFADEANSAAQKAYEAQQWSSAADQYGKLTQTEPKNPLYWYRLGNASRRAGDLAKAESALKQAQQLGFQPMMVNVGLAAVLSLNGNSRQSSRPH